VKQLGYKDYNAHIR